MSAIKLTKRSLFVCAAVLGMVTAGHAAMNGTHAVHADVRPGVQHATQTPAQKATNIKAASNANANLNQKPAKPASALVPSAASSANTSAVHASSAQSSAAVKTASQAPSSAVSSSAVQPKANSQAPSSAVSSANAKVGAASVGASSASSSVNVRSAAVNNLLSNAGNQVRSGFSNSADYNQFMTDYQNAPKLNGQGANANQWIQYMVKLGQDLQKSNSTDANATQLKNGLTQAEDSFGLKALFNPTETFNADQLENDLNRNGNPQVAQLIQNLNSLQTVANGNSLQGLTVPNNDVNAIIASEVATGNVPSSLNLSSAANLASAAAQNPDFNALNPVLQHTDAMITNMDKSFDQMGNNFKQPSASQNGKIRALAARLAKEPNMDMVLAEGQKLAKQAKAHRVNKHARKHVAKRGHRANKRNRRAVRRHGYKRGRRFVRKHARRRVVRRHARRAIRRRGYKRGRRVVRRHARRAVRRYNLAKHYLTNRSFKNKMPYVILSKPCTLHSSVHFNRGNSVQLYTGRVMKIKNVKRVGKSVRLQTTNGWYITGNRAFVHVLSL